MGQAEIQSFTLPGWFVIAGPLGALTVRASLTPDGIQIEIPTPRRSLLRTWISASSFAEKARQASHLEAVIALASLLDPETIDQALALVLETCEDAAEAFDTEETRDRSDALTFLASAVRGEVLP